MLDKLDYNSKVLELLNCDSTYERCDSKMWLKMSLEFSQKVRKILSNCRGGGGMKYLLESAPSCPFLRATVKTHKVGFPARPITNDVVVRLTDSQQNSAPTWPRRLGGFLDDL